MKNTVLCFTAFFMCVSSLFTGCDKEAVQPPDPQYVAMERAQMVQIAKDAYVYGFPLVMTEITKRYMTNPLPATGNLPVNRVRNFRSFADDKFKNFVRPGADMFYSFAWLDLSREPILFEIPDTGKRYALFTLTNAWTDILVSFGRRAASSGSKKFAVTGPKWEGTLPEGFTEYRSDTNIVLFTGLIQVNGKQDGETAVRTIQNGIKLYPLSAYGKKYTPPKARADDTLSSKTPLEQVLSMNISDFFNMFNQMMLNNPPYSEDAAILDKILDLGIAPGMRFDLSTFDFDTQEAFKEIPKWMGEHMESVKTENADKGWIYTYGLGKYNTDYRLRAKTAYLNFGGAGFDFDIVQMTSYTDADNEKYDSSKKYIIRFKKDEIPKVNALWSVSAYNNEGFFSKNPLKRYSLVSKDGIKFNKDGSLDIYIQKDNPGKNKESNWLPVGENEFSLVLRCYWPKDELAEGKWKVPAVIKAR